jgi:anti-sigma B factor antagonist
MVVQSDSASEVRPPVRESSIEVNRSAIGHISVIAVRGELDMLTSPQLSDAIDDALASSPEALVIDLSEVTFLASAALQALVAGHAAAGEVTGFAVVADGPATSRPIRILGLDSLLSVRPTLADAISGLRNADRTQISSSRG